MGQATKKCVKLHTECKSTLGLCKNKKYTQITQSVWKYTLILNAAYSHKCCGDYTPCTLCIALNTLCGITQKVSNYYTEKC